MYARLLRRLIFFGMTFAYAWAMMHGQAHYRHDGNAVLNDLKYSPGAVDASLTKERLCNPQFHTASVRNVSRSEKKQVCREYGITRGCPGPRFELDHIVSIELGGSNSAENLFPQPIDTRRIIGFHTKDKLENRLHRMVCSGAISLADAQACIRTDWYACLLKTSARKSN